MEYAIVTGCASGIGKRVAEQLHSKGVRVFGLDINKCEYSFSTYVCEVSDETQVIKCISKIAEYTDKVDYLVNCAGMLTIGKPLAIKDMSIKQWDAILRINLRSVMIMIKHVYPFLKKADHAGIINLSSEQTMRPQPGFLPYVVSKSGINALTKYCAQEFLEDEIRVNAVALGTVNTGILSSYCEEDACKLFSKKEESIPFGVMSADEAANLIIYLLSKENRYMTGEIVRADGGGHLCV
ncbi:MAG: SDR family oxidoreductase [Acetatifactor sp.]|nr:SDR family oxidoreductase [Acetatifactor sp.]